MAWTKQGRVQSGLSVKPMDGWTSLFTTAASLPGNLWRGIARFAGAHVYCEENDIVLADSSIVALHTVKSGKKQIRLPRAMTVHDVIAGRKMGSEMSMIEFECIGPETRVFRIE